MTIKPFLLIFFDNFEKACFAILFFDLPSLWQDFLLLYVQHNGNYVDRRIQYRKMMKINDIKRIWYYIKTCVGQR